MLDISEVMKDYIDQVTAAKIGWSWVIPKVAVENFKPHKRGPKPTRLILEQTKEIISEALEQTKEGDTHDQQ